MEFPKTSQISVFEKDLIAVVTNIKFRHARTHQGDIKSIHNSKKTMTFGDKTSSIYRLTKEEPNNLLRNAIAPKYEKTNSNIKDKINKNGKEILKKKEVLHRVDINEERNGFFTPKDHKENFQITQQ